MNALRTALLNRYESSLYWRFKSSRVQRLYQRLARPELASAHGAEVQLYQTLTGLSKGDLVFDVGANVGSKTAIFLELGARVVAIEPDELSQRRIALRFLRYRLLPRPVQLVGKAVSDKVAVAEMLVDGPGSAVNTLNPGWASALRANRESFPWAHSGLEFNQKVRVETTTLEALTSEYGQPQYIKIDVEGHEIAVLNGLKSPVKCLSFEVNPPLRDDGIACIELLDHRFPGGHFRIVRIDEGLVGDPTTGHAMLDMFTSNPPQTTVEVFWRSKDLRY
jgi:FkbM family methyltransferase